MDDFVLSNLYEAKNEWCGRLVSVFTPLVIEGIRSMFNEAWTICVENDEVNKYLMTFQNLLSRIPKWNDAIIEDERKRIIQRSGCNYLEDLITCVHIIQLKVLTSIRVGNKQKKIDISIPKLDSFIHKVYIHVARKVYVNIYLFEKTVSPLQQQKNNRELEVIVQECILTAIRDSIPTEDIIRAYMDEAVEQEEEVIIEPIEEEVVVTDASSNEIKSSIIEEVAPPSSIPNIENIDDKPTITRLTFNDYDSVIDTENRISAINAPKTIERLEQISTERAIQRKMQEEEDSDDDINDRIQIHNDTVSLDFEDLEPKKAEEMISLDFEELI